jgi:transcriptional regulator with XRE-family HTH domain
VPSRASSASLARQLGARIRALRLEAKVTQEQLAWDCDLDKGYLSQVEAGKRTPSVPVLAAIAKRLGVEMADIVGYRLTEPRLRLLDAARRGDLDATEKALKRLGLLPIDESEE